MSPYAEREEVEVFWILALNTQHQVIRNRPLSISRGILDSAMVHPREVFRAAIQANAAAIIAVHNHPSGDPTPSAEDRCITTGLKAAGAILGIPLRDHLVIGGGKYVSFAAVGEL
jgi:DNA repair protein RadC